MDSVIGENRHLIGLLTCEMYNHFFNDRKVNMCLVLYEQPDLASSVSSHHTIIVVTVMIIITINIIITSNEINGNTDSANTNTATLP